MLTVLIIVITVINQVNALDAQQVILIYITTLAMTLSQQTLIVIVIKYVHHAVLGAKNAMVLHIKNA